MASLRVTSLDGGVDSGSPPEKGRRDSSSSSEEEEAVSLGAAQEKLSSFDGVNMKLFHSLLELKRKRCFHRHGGAAAADGQEDGEWVLSAFPVPPLPCEQEYYSS